MKDWQLAYIAGVIDSDGCISLILNSKTGWVRPRVAINQVQPEAIDFIISLFGGNLYIAEQPEESVWKDRYEWRLYSLRKVKPFLIAILPFLQIKSRQAQLVIEFCSLRLNKLGKRYQGGKHNKTYTEREMIVFDNVKSLNQRGVYAG